VFAAVFLKMWVSLLFLDFVQTSAGREEAGQSDDGTVRHPGGQNTHQLTEGEAARKTQGNCHEKI